MKYEERVELTPPQLTEKTIFKKSSLIRVKSQNKVPNAFCFQDRIPKELISGAVFKFQCGLCNESYYGEYVRYLNERIAEHIGISALTKRKVKSKGCAVSYH